MRFKQIDDTAQLAAMKSVVLDYRPVVDVYQHLISSAKHMDMRWIVIIGTDHNIKAVASSVEYCDHKPLRATLDAAASQVLCDFRWRRTSLGSG